MGLLANPDRKVIKVPMHGGYIVSELRTPTTKETLAYRTNRHKVKPGKRDPFKDLSDRLKIEIYDTTILKASAEDESENPTDLDYQDDAGDIHTLTPLVENWKSYISASAKIASMSFLDRMDAEEADLEKN